MLKRTHAPLLAVLALTSIACGNKPSPTPTKDPAPPTASSPASVVSAAPPVVKARTTFTMERFAPGDVSPSALFPIEGALMVGHGRRVGRIVDDKVEWVGEIPEGGPPFGENILQHVVGRWPDSAAAIYVSGNGRAPQPTWHPLTGKTPSHTVAPGGVGMIEGVARLGESTVLLARSPGFEAEIVSVRGPRLNRKLATDKQAGCKPGEMHKWSEDMELPAVTPRTMESTPEGTLVTLGQLCSQRAPTAEVWDKAGKSRFIDLGRFWKKLHWSPVLRRGRGDELFAYSTAFDPVLRYHDGDFTALPLSERPIDQIFTSPDGQLHAYDGQNILRFEEGKWSEVGRFAEPKGLRTLAVYEGTFWASAEYHVHKLRAAPSTGEAGPEACSTWFVYLYQVNDKSEPKFTFPATRKALSTFPELADLGLLDYGSDYHRHLGVRVKSRAQGEAVIAHVKANMADEDPRLFCYAPGKPRQVDLPGK